jgi:hypothetical protein
VLGTPPSDNDDDDEDDGNDDSGVRNGEDNGTHARMHACTLAPHLHQLQSCARKWSLCLLPVSLRASMPTGSSPFDLHELCCALSMHTMMQLGRRALATT